MLLQRGQLDPNFQVEWVDLTNHSYQKTRLNCLSYGIQIWTDLFPVLSQSTRLTEGQTYRQTIGQTAFSSSWSALAFHAEGKNCQNTSAKKFFFRGDPTRQRDRQANRQTPVINKISFAEVTTSAPREPILWKCRSPN